MSEIAYPLNATTETVRDASGLPVCDVSWLERDIDEVRALARRIAACLNACRDISTEDLERVAELQNIDARLVVRVNNSGSAAREG